MLKAYLPYKTELDFWKGNCYVSLVGFLFRKVRVKGILIPFHTTFEEVNLRFYVRYKSGDKWKRGVVFIKELVPKPAVTFIANRLYRENYETLRMDHHWVIDKNELDISYSWKKKGWHTLRAIAINRSAKIKKGSEEEFITEHYWGYARFADKITNEYEVVHPKWDVYPVMDHEIKVDFEKVYGRPLGFLSGEAPRSVFLAEGSPIEVKGGLKLT